MHPSLSQADTPVLLIPHLSMALGQDSYNGGENSAMGSRADLSTGWSLSEAAAAFVDAYINTSEVAQNSDGRYSTTVHK